MARASLTDIQAQVYNYLNVDGGTWGAYVANQRYTLAGINDAIYDADNAVAMLLAKNGQEPLMLESASTKNIPTTGTVITNAGEENYVVISVTDANGYLKEVSFAEYELMSQASFNTILGSTYGYYAIKNGKLYFLNGVTPVVVTYYSFLKNTTIKSPDGFEPAIAFRTAEIMLMKRGDKPDASAFYGTKFKEFMQSWIVMQEISTQEFVEK